MRRRKFIAGLGSAAAWPVVGRGQNKKPPLVGYLSPAGGPFSIVLFDAFTNKMQELGYVSGKNIQVEYRNANGDFSRLPALAIELVALAPDVIVGANSSEHPRYLS